MPHKAPDRSETRPVKEGAPTLFPEHYIIFAIWIASVVIAIVAVAR